MSEEEVEKLRLKIAWKIDSNGAPAMESVWKNVQDRIHIAFGDQYGIEIASKLGCYTKNYGPDSNHAQTVREKRLGA